MNAMKSLFLAVIILAAGADFANAEVMTRSSKTVVIPNDTTTEQSTRLIKEATPDVLPALSDQGDKPRRSPSEDNPLTRHLVSHYSMYYVEMMLEYDDDEDGYYHGFRLLFDADIHEGLADVYAVIYISLEGGPWNYFYTTDVFTLYGSEGSDELEIASVLEEGYPPGHYDFQIELYEADTNELVLVYDDIDTDALALLPMEDMDYDLLYHYYDPVPVVHDETYDEAVVGVDYEVHATGSWGPLGLLMMAALTALAVTRRRRH